MYTLSAGTATENSAAFCAQVPSSSRWVSEIRRFSGSTVRTAAKMDCPTVNRSLGWQMRDTDRFSMPMSDGTPIADESMLILRFQ